MRDRWNWNGIRDSEKEKERKRDGWKLIYDSRSGFFLRRSRHRDRSPVDWWMITQSSRSTRQRQSPPPTWLSHRWICRVVGRDQVWNEEFGTALIAAIHTGLRTGLTRVVERTGGRTQQAQSFQARLWRVYRVFFVSSLFSLHRGGQLPHPQIRANDFPYSVYLKYEFHLILSDLELFIYVLWTWLFSGGFVSVNAIEKKENTQSTYFVHNFEFDMKTNGFQMAAGSTRKFYI